MFPKFWQWLATMFLILIVVAILIGLWCFCTTPSGTQPATAAEEPAAISSLEASLGEVQVTPGVDPTTRTFQLFAWYRDADDNIVSGRFDPMEWSLTPTADGTVEHGSVSIEAFPASGVGPAQTVVRAEDASNASRYDLVTLIRWAGSAEATTSGGGSDVVEAPHDSGEPPNVVLLEEGPTGKCSWDKGIAFVGAAAVGEQAQIPCSVSLFSASHAMLFDIPTAATLWASPGATIALSPGGSLPLKVSIFIAVTSRTASALSGVPLTGNAQLLADVVAAATAQAQVDVDWANLVFEASRVGLSVVATYDTLDPAVDLLKKVGADPFNCGTPRAMAEPTDPTFDRASYEPSTISVYYVDWIDYPSDPLHPGSRGAHCPYWLVGDPGPVVYISYTRHSSVTLAHELGHALSLGEAEGTLGTVNVMNNLAPDGPLGASARSRFTLGQVHRMNVSDESWLNTVPGGRNDLKRSCGIVGQCPTLDSDVR